MSAEPGYGAGVAALERPPRVEPFVRGALFPAVLGTPYPRALGTGAGLLPADTWAAARRPVGVRIEVSGTAESVAVSYEADEPDLTFLAEDAVCYFTAWSGDEVIARERAQAGSHRVVLPMAAALRRGEDRLIIHLPEGMNPRILHVEGVGGSVMPSAPQPRWVAYGDSITEGWIATDPGRCWPAIAGRRVGLDTVNMGYAGASRGEVQSAEQIAAAGHVDIVSLAYGTNCWTRVPFRADQLALNLEVFIDVIRQGHPQVPVVVFSPVTRPDAESTPNRLGSTLADLRAAVEGVASDRINGGDEQLRLVRGDVLTAEQLPDGVHPGDKGHELLAARMVGPLAELTASLR